MTDTLDAADGLTGKPNVAAGFRAWHRPVSMLNRISGKKVVEAVRLDLGQTEPPRAGVLKSCGCDAKTGAGGSFSRGSSDSRERNGLARSDSGQCQPSGKRLKQAPGGEDSDGGATPCANQEY